MNAAKLILVAISMFMPSFVMALNSSDVKKCLSAGQAVILMPAVKTDVHGRVIFEGDKSYRIEVPEPKSLDTPPSGYVSLPERTFPSLKGKCVYAFGVKSIENLAPAEQVNCRSNTASFELLEGAKLDDYFREILEEYKFSFESIQMLQDAAKQKNKKFTDSQAPALLNAFKQNCQDIGTLAPVTAKLLKSVSKQADNLLEQMKPSSSGGSQIKAQQNQSVQ